MLFAVLLVAAPIHLDWPINACPTRRSLSQALRTYDLSVEASASVMVTGSPRGQDGYMLVVTARGTKMQHEIAVPKACADRAAVIAVVIEALVAPYFWPAGKPKPTSLPAVSALDFLMPASKPASVPASEPMIATSGVPASEPVASLPASAPFVAPLRQEVPLALYVFGAPDFALNERTRGRVGLGFAVGAPTFVRWFFEASFLSLRTATLGSGRIDYGEGHLMLGADLALIAGWFAGAGVGLQILHAVASGFDVNRSATLAGATLEARTGYRHVVARHFELGLHGFLRADLFRQRLLVDTTLVDELAPLHVGVALTGGVTW